MIESGKTYRLTYGNGFQLFHVVRISSKGKPFGYRLFGWYWRIASLKVDDPRIIGEHFNTRTINGDPLPVLPTPLVEKIDLKPFKDAMVDPKAAYEADKAKQEKDWGGDDWREKRGAAMEEWKASIQEGNRLGRIYWPLKKAFGEAKVLNSLVSAKSDLSAWISRLYQKETRKEIS